MRDGDGVRLIGVLRGDEGVLLVEAELQLAAWKRADADFRALKVCEDGERAANRLFSGADIVEGLAMVLMAAMAEIEAEDVGTGFSEQADRL